MLCAFIRHIRTFCGLLLVVQLVQLNIIYVLSFSVAFCMQLLSRFEIKKSKAREKFSSPVAFYDTADTHAVPVFCIVLAVHK